MLVALLPLDQSVHVKACDMIEKASEINLRPLSEVPTTGSTVSQPDGLALLPIVDNNTVTVYLITIKAEKMLRIVAAEASADADWNATRPWLFQPGT